MLFLQTVVNNLVFTNFSGPKCHAVAFTASIFAGFYVCHTDISGGGAVAIETFPLLLALTLPPTLIYLCKTHLSWPRADLPAALWGIQPTVREVTDLKKAVSVRVNSVQGHNVTHFLDLL
jgi:hypothetical protein